MNECQLRFSDKQCKDVLKTSHLNPPCLQSCQVIWLITTWGNCWNSRRHLWEKFLQTRCLELSPLVLTESWLWRISWLLWAYFITFMLQSGSNHYTDMAQRVWSRLLWVLAWKEATFQCVISFTINMISFSVPPPHTPSNRLPQVLSWATPSGSMLHEKSLEDHFWILPVFAIRMQLVPCSSQKLQRGYQATLGVKGGVGQFPSAGQSRKTHTIKV